MTARRIQVAASEPALAFHLLGRVALDDAWELQQQLVAEAAERSERRAVVLLCEHPPVITIGRLGSRGHIRLSSEQLRHEQLPVRWLSRGGGCILHAPGQLAVYPIVPLELLGWSVGQYLRRLQRGLLAALETLHVRSETRPDRFAIWGRSGLLTAVGVSIRSGVACQGAFLNVNPPLRLFGFVDSVPADPAHPGQKPTFGCLLAERQAAVRMSSVRSAVIDGLAQAFGSERCHLHTGHPLLASAKNVTREPTACDV